MSEKIKSVFDKIHAENELKQNTKNYIYKKTFGYNLKKYMVIKKSAIAVACLIFTITCSYMTYYTQAAVINVDSDNPVSMGINVFNRVISVDDNTGLAHQLKHMNYIDAVEYIVNNNLSNNDIIVSVVGNNQNKCQAMADYMCENNVCGNSSIPCYAVNNDIAQEAYNAGLSVGKYCLYLDLQKSNPDITIDDVKNMSFGQCQNVFNENSSHHGYGNNGRNGFGHGRHE